MLCVTVNGCAHGCSLALHIWPCLLLSVRAAERFNTDPSPVHAASRTPRFLNVIEHHTSVQEQAYCSSCWCDSLCFSKTGTTDILFHWYVCVWAEGAPPQDYLEGERLRFTSGGCYVGESFSKNHEYGAVSKSACSEISTFCRGPCSAVSLIPVFLSPPPTARDCFQITLISLLAITSPGLAVNGDYKAA